VVFAVLSEGAEFAGYRIERVLGSGGMGTVYLARSPILPRSEAIKVLSTELSRDGEFRARFVREAAVAAGLDHPNVVSIYRRGEFEGQLWIAMQFVDGTDADDALVAGTMTPARAVYVVGEVAKALDYAHQHQVVHRDVKPANFLLSGPTGPEERVLLGDFGIARALDDAKLTQTGSFMATVAYAAPEVLAGDAFDGRADLYSLGCTLFRLLSGAPPYESTNGMAAVMAAHLTAPPPRLSDRVSGFSPRLDAVLATAMAKDPGQRFGSAREFAAAAGDALGERTTVALRPLPGSSVAPYAPPTMTGTQQGWQPLQQPGPLGYPPPGPLVFSPPAKGRRLPWILLAASVVVAVTLVAVWVTLFVRSKHGSAPGAAPTAGAVTSTSPTVSPSGLLGLLLPSKQAAEIVGAPQFVVLASLGQVVDDAVIDQGFGTNLDCPIGFSPAQHRFYANTGLTSARVQVLGDGNTPAMYVVQQAVISFPTADAAKKAVDGQLPQWSACANRTVTVNQPNKPPQRFTFGALSNDNGTLSMVDTKEDINGWQCLRGLTTRENIVIDVNVCRPDLANQGLDILNAIAARIKP
jgi:eukaryotic-like serine/threonine-protein kinase